MAGKETIPKWQWKVIAGILLAVALFFWYRSCNKKTSGTQVPWTDSVSYWKNEYGKEFASRKAAADQFAISRSIDLDSMASLFNGKTKLLQEVAVLKQKGSVVIKTPGAPTIVFKEKRDTVSGECLTIDRVEQDFSSPYYKAHAIIPLNGDSSSLKLETYDTLAYVARLVREGGLFNRKTFLQIDASNSNPDNKITGLDVYRKALPRPKKIGIGFQVGGRVTVTKTFLPAVKPYFGFGATYSIIRF